jgi:hypothetical protein
MSTWSEEDEALRADRNRRAGKLTITLIDEDDFESQRQSVMKLTDRLLNAAIAGRGVRLTNDEVRLLRRVGSIQLRDGLEYM